MSRYDDDNGFGGSLNRPGREALDREEASWQAYSSQCEAITQSKLQAEIYTLKIENAELHMECDRLTNLLQWEQNRRERIGTHGDECWKWGPAHHECAMREIERITAMLGPQKVLGAEEVTEPGIYLSKTAAGEIVPMTIRQDLIDAGHVYKGMDYQGPLVWEEE